MLIPTLALPKQLIRRRSSLLACQSSASKMIIPASRYDTTDYPLYSCCHCSLADIHRLGESQHSSTHYPCLLSTFLTCPKRALNRASERGYPKLPNRCCLISKRLNGTTPAPTLSPYTILQTAQGNLAEFLWRVYHPFLRAKRLFSNARTFDTLNWTYSRSSASMLSFCISRRSSSLRSSSSRPRFRPL